MCSHLLSGRPHWSLRSEWHCQVPSAQGLAGSGWKISALDPLGQGCHRGPVIRSTEPRGRKHEPRLGMGEGGHRRRAGRACCRRLVLEGGEQVGSWVHRVGGSGELWLTKDEAPVSISCCICLWDLPDGFTEGDWQGGSCSFPQESTACRRTREKSPLSPGFGKAPPGRQLWSLQRISLPGPRGSKVPQTEWPKTIWVCKKHLFSYQSECGSPRSRCWWSQPPSRGFGEESCIASYSFPAAPGAPWLEAVHHLAFPQPPATSRWVLPSWEDAYPWIQGLPRWSRMISS